MLLFLNILIIFFNYIFLLIILNYYNDWDYLVIVVNVYYQEQKQKKNFTISWYERACAGGNQLSSTQQHCSFVEDESDSSKY